MIPALHIGLVVNPVAGAGGSAGFKGSDEQRSQDLAFAAIKRGELPRSLARVQRALAPLAGEARAACKLSTAGAWMGEAAAAAAGLDCDVVYYPGKPRSCAQDTRDACRALLQAGVDLLLFCGGDGTARDVFDVLGPDRPALGIPAGVKMHSGVYAVSPEAAGELLVTLARAGLVDLTLREVRDLDETAFREDKVRTRFYGELLVPSPGRYLQATKIAGVEDVRLAAAEIAAGLVPRFDSKTLYLLGPGSTVAAISEQLELPFTLLGVDVVCGGVVLAQDVDETQLLRILAQHNGAVQMVLTAIGGQGHLFGRGNQQFSPRVIRAVGTDNLCIVAAKSKITALHGRPLIADTNDPQLDRELAGYHRVYTGYEDSILYPVGGDADMAPV